MMPFSVTGQSEESRKFKSHPLDMLQSVSFPVEVEFEFTT